MFEQLLKSMGLNPAEIKNQINQASDNFKRVCNYFDMRLTQQDKKLDLIMATLNIASPSPSPSPLPAPQTSNVELEKTS